MSGHDDRILVGRGALVAAPGIAGPPGSGATITIINTADVTTPLGMAYPQGLPWNRLQFSMISSHDSAASGVVRATSLDRGTNFDTVATSTYLTADGQTTYDMLTRGGHVKITYQNSANVLTVWRWEIWAIRDRNPGS
jgi:hypothetical protein